MNPFLYNRQDLNNVDVAKDWRLIMTSVEIDKCVEKCAVYIDKHFHGKKLIVACIMKGAVCFHVDLTRKLTIPHSWYFIEASSYHDAQTQSEQLEILSVIVPEKFKDHHVILIDELFDNGTTMLQVKDQIHIKANVPLDKIFTCTLFRKNKSTSPFTSLQNNLKFNDLDLYGIMVPNVWLVGYGLDDQQEKRNWTYLYACPKIEGIPLTPDDAIFTDHIAYIKMREKVNILSN